jgi:nicotinate-nucleotide adenylyltransferase
VKQIIIYGGSFNPFHNGHAAIAQHCFTLAGFDEVWIMPSAQRADKPDLVDDTQRLAMLTDYVASCGYDQQRLKVSDFEIALGAPSETITTYHALVKAYPNTNFTFVFGADSIADIYNWRDGDYLAETLDIIVVDRISNLKPITNPRHLRAEIPEDVSGISSTTIRARIKLGEPIEPLVPAAVARYIPLHNLYV